MTGWASLSGDARFDLPIRWARNTRSPQSVSSGVRQAFVPVTEPQSEPEVLSCRRAPCKIRFTQTLGGISSIPTKSVFLEICRCRASSA